MKISATIITLNEEAHIEAAIASLHWADEILVVDSESTDRTREIAAKLGAKVLVRKWEGFAAQKQFAIDQAANDWVFSLDADERVSDALAAEISELDETKLADGYRIPRLSIYLGREIRHSGWYPDWQMRLFNRQKGRWKPVLIHESFELSNPTKLSKLRSDILHFSVENISQHHRMIGERYAPLAAQQMYQNGRRTSFFKILLAGPATFFRTFVLQMGFRDGVPGLCIATFAGYHAVLKHMLLWELQQKKRSKSGNYNQ